MAKTQKPGDQKPPEQEEKKKAVPMIEEHGNKLDKATYAGVCVRMKWKPGKRVSKSDFDKAVKEFLTAPISGKTVKTEKKEASE